MHKVKIVWHSIYGLKDSCLYIKANGGWSRLLSSLATKIKAIENHLPCSKIFHVVNRQKQKFTLHSWHFLFYRNKVFGNLYTK